MIIIKISGGLGNQLFQYSVGRAVSEHHQVPLKVDISDYETYKLHNGYRLDQFNIDVAAASKDEIKSFKGSNGGLGKLFRLSGLSKKHYREKQRNIVDDFIFKRPDLYLDGYWQNEAYFHRIRNRLISELQPLNPLAPSSETYRDSILRSNSVSLHVRRGDYLNHPHIGVLDISFYKDAVSYIESKINDPVFYIFSDDHAWCRENLGFIKNIKFVENSGTEIDDLILMSCCQHNITANSSFSWWGSWINTNKDKIVVAPKKWLAVDSPGCKWAADGWVEL